MSDRQYIDFVVLFQPLATGFRLKVIDSPAGQASTDFSFPFSDLELENFFLRVGRMREAVRRLGAKNHDPALVFGRRLFEAAFRDEVRSCLRSSVEEARRKGFGLRILLRLGDTPDLNDLPWELLLNPSNDLFYALSEQTPIVRYLDLPEGIEPLEVKSPLRILVVIASPSDYPSLDVEREWGNLRKAVSRLEGDNHLILERLEESTLTCLLRRMKKESFHILHFIGHGGYDPQAQEGLLLFTDDHGKGRPVGGQMLGTLLHDHRSLRLVVLNACEGARTSRTDPFAGVAQSLVRKSIPAVIAMQFEITDQAAIIFSEELYTAVAGGDPVDAALSASRRALFSAGHELEWGTPVLYSRLPDGRIFDFVPAAALEPAVERSPGASPTIASKGIGPSNLMVDAAAPGSPKTHRLAIWGRIVQLSLNSMAGIGLLAVLLFLGLYWALKRHDPAASKGTPSINTPSLPAAKPAAGKVGSKSGAGAHVIVDMSDFYDKVSSLIDEDLPTGDCMKSDSDYMELKIPHKEFNVDDGLLSVELSGDTDFLVCKKRKTFLGMVPFDAKVDGQSFYTRVDIQLVVLDPSTLGVVVHNPSINLKGSLRKDRKEPEVNAIFAIGARLRSSLNPLVANLCRVSLPEDFLKLSPKISYARFLSGPGHLQASCDMRIEADEETIAKLRALVKTRPEITIGPSN